MRIVLVLIAAALATPAFAQSKSIAATLDDDKVICKRQVETGSLVRARKTCMSRRDWKEQMLRAQNDTRQAILPINSQAPQ